MASKVTKATEAAPRRRRPRWAVDAEESVAKPASETEDRYHSRTIERALDVLDAFQSSSSAMSLKEVSSLTGQPEASLYRVLSTLQKRDYLSQNRDGTYQLTRKVLYGRLLDKADAVRKAARPVLEQLVREFNETTSLSYLFTNYIQVLDTVETFHPIRVTNRAGRILPPYCSSMGKAILAYQDDSVGDVLLETYGLIRRTEHTIVDRLTLRDELAKVRKQGWACDREESMLGGICYGAPIFDASGATLGALSVSTPVQRMDDARGEQIRAAVMKAAKQVTNLLR
jgi:DNA-binding IclR family transcriptional regulator